MSSSASLGAALAPARVKGCEIKSSDGDGSKDIASFRLTHTMPCERGGLTMRELSNAMKKDAIQQVKLSMFFHCGNPGVGNPGVDLAHSVVSAVKL